MLKSIELTKCTHVLSVGNFDQKAIATGNAADTKECVCICVCSCTSLPNFLARKCIEKSNNACAGKWTRRTDTQREKEGEEERARETRTRRSSLLALVESSAKIYFWSSGKSSDIFIST